MGKFPKRDNGPSPHSNRVVTQDTVDFLGLASLFDAFEAQNKVLAPDSLDRTVYVVHYVSGSPMTSLMVTPTKAADD